jgi:hypothetical protein
MEPLPCYSLTAFLAQVSKVGSNLREILCGAFPANGAKTPGD